MLSESAARWLLVLHTALSVATVGALTYLVIWMRGYARGVTSRHRGKRCVIVAREHLFESLEHRSPSIL